MLSYAFQELRKNNYDEIKGEKFDDVYDLFAEILSRGVSSLLKQGLHRNYVARENELATLRGKLNMSTTIRLYARGVKRLDCEYDEYSENIVFNQILKTTSASKDLQGLTSLSIRLNTSNITVQMAEPYVNY